MTAKSAVKRGRYGPDSELVDYILGITFEIWEGRGVELIHQYYAADCVVHGLDAVQQGAQAMAESTYAYLKAFPDRLLLADELIWSGDRAGGFLSSHRIISPMTNLGASAYGPATGKSVRVVAIADCLVENGLITREWLVRDGLALVRQLGFDALPAARRIAESRSAATADWLASELARVPAGEDYDHELKPLAGRVLRACWESGEQEELRSLYAPYAVLHLSPLERRSGAPAIASHFAALRKAFGEACVRIDHIAAQPWGQTGRSVAVRWGLSARHQGAYEGLPASGRRVFILGVSHWRLVGDRIVTDWTLFDRLGLLAQMV